jgi:hypothetical protein
MVVRDLWALRLQDFESRITDSTEDDDDDTESDTDTDRKPHQKRCEITQCNRIDQARPFEVPRVWFDT